MKQRVCSRCELWWDEGSFGEPGGCKTYGCTGEPILYVAPQSQSQPKRLLKKVTVLRMADGYLVVCAANARLATGEQGALAEKIEFACSGIEEAFDRARKYLTTYAEDAKDVQP